MTEKKPLHEGVQRGQTKHIVHDGAIEPAAPQPNKAVAPPPKPAPLPKK
jgi:hypothetical protein